MKYLTYLNLSKDNKYNLTKISLFYVAWVQEVHMLYREKTTQLQQYNDKGSSAGENQPVDWEKNSILSDLIL